MDWIKSHTELITLSFSFLITISTIVYVILTRQLVKESKLVRKSSIEPYISLYLKNPETKTNILFLFIENIGNGPARNIKFRIIKDINYLEFCNPLKDHLHFKDGITYFPPKEKIQEYLISEMEEKVFDDFIEVEVSYEDILENKYLSVFKLIFREAIWHGISEPPDTYEGEISYYLKKIFKLYEKELKKK